MTTRQSTIDRIQSELLASWAAQGWVPVLDAHSPHFGGLARVETVDQGQQAALRAKVGRIMGQA